MAAPSRLPLLQVCSTRVFSLRCTQGFHSEPAVREPAYPPVIPSRTAKSKSAKKRREEDYHSQICAASSVQDKLRLLTKLQRDKYVVYPQTFTLNADRWYQHFTKTVFLPGLPEKCSVGRQVVDNENGKVPPAAGAVDPAVVDENTFSELRSLVGNGILQENFYLKKRRPFLQKEQEHFVAPFLSNLVSSVTNALAKYNPLLKKSSLGSKVTDPCSYGHTQFHLVHDRFKRDRLIKGNLADQIEVRLRANAIASLFAWTGAQAMYQGPNFRAAFFLLPIAKAEGALWDTGPGQLGLLRFSLFIDPVYYLGYPFHCFHQPWISLAHPLQLDLASA
ncbi:28S ribosomal protein S30, mitochondrial [Acipenser ruthenus]|uniref:28S ribosomal protein S30, mitochondrial n=1 Tax=Acipenser ruthenus TaxID=7906 RepID=A0A444V4I2_ACIRT|nr:28S ribosomal protein S30, mitochondrial [Acipenser ruthenus]